MFPLCQVSMYSFPFFVRGDDIEFSYTNKFNIINLNGVGIWQEDFKVKESPLTIYFDVRSHILHHLVIKHLDHGILPILNLVWSFFNYFNGSYEYHCGKAIVMAFADIQEGPVYWLKNMDTSALRARIKKECYTDKYVKQPLRKDYKDIPEADRNIRLPLLPKTLRKYSYNGHFLPSFLFSEKLTKRSIHLLVPPRLFLRKQILVYDECTQFEMLLKFDRSLFFRNLIPMIFNTVKFVIKYGKLKNEYRKFMTTLKKSELWKQEFQKRK